jgi:hypothetical protein
MTCLLGEAKRHPSVLAAQVQVGTARDQQLYQLDIAKAAA